MRISFIAFLLLTISTLAWATIRYHRFSWDDEGLCAALPNGDWKPAQVRGTWLAEIQSFAEAGSPIRRVVLCVTHGSPELLMSDVAHEPRTHEDQAFVIGLNEDFVSRFETRAVKAMVAHEIGHVLLGERGDCNRFKRPEEYTYCEHEVDEEGVKLVLRCDMILALSDAYAYLRSKNIDADGLAERIDLLDPTQNCKKKTEA